MIGLAVRLRSWRARHVGAVPSVEVDDDRTPRCVHLSDVLRRADGRDHENDLILYLVLNHYFSLFPKE